MPPLRSLERENPAINSDFINFCAAHGIVTVEDFLLYNVDVLFTSAERQFSSEMLKQGINCLLSVTDSMHCPWSNGVDVLASKRRSSTYNNALLELERSYLHGGFITEVVGPSSSGKTQVCLVAAASFATENDAGVVLYVDTGNSFSARRIEKVVHASSTGAHKAIGQVMDNIKCHPVFSVFSFLALLQQLEIELTNQMQAGGQCLVRLLVVDSLSSLITPVLGGSGPNGHALMVSVGYFLKKLANEYNMCVLVTNHMVGGGGFAKPALGESWKSIPHVRILLSQSDHRQQSTTTHNMTLLKHPSMATKDYRLKLPDNPVDI